MQICLTVDYLKALAAKRDVRKNEGVVKYYINEFDHMAGELVKIRRLTQYNSMILFLERMPVGIARRVN